MKARTRTSTGRFLALALGFIGFAANAAVERFSFTDLNRAIPDGTRMGMYDLHTVQSEIQLLSAVRVRLHTAGQFNGDIYAYVRHVNAQSTNFCVLLNRSGRSAANAAGYSDSGLNVTFDSSAATDVHLYRTATNLPTGTPLVGTWQPDGRNADPLGVLDTSNRTTSLNSFAGVNASGEWALFVADLDAGATNILLGWELELVGAVTPPLSWPNPAPIVYGTVLGPAQLNATVGNVPGSFVYSPPAGTVLRPGTNSLSVTFTPVDTASYVSATSSVALIVSRAPLTVTAADASRLYGEENPVFVGTVTGLQNGESIDAAYSCSAAPTSPIGNYIVVPSVSGAALSNYTVTLLNGALTVNPALLTVQAGNASRVYGDVNPVFTGTISGIKNGESISATYTCGATTFTTVGNYAIVPSPSGATLSNYTLNLVNGTLTVRPAALSVRAGNTNRVYGDSNPVFTGTIVGIKNNESIVPVYSCNATPSSPVGIYSIVASVSGPTVSNYTVTVTNGAFTITPAILTVTAHSTNRVYGTPNPSFTGSLVGIKNSESISATYSCAASLNSPAGSYAIVPGVTGATLSNYTVASTSGALTISRASSSMTVSSSKNPQVAGQPVTFSAMLSPVAPTVGTPTGSVQFKVDGVSTAPPAPITSGLASYTTDSLFTGSHTITVEFAGDQNFTGITNSLAPAQLIQANWPPPTLSILDLGNGSVRIRVAGATNCVCVVEYKATLGSSTWTTLTNGVCNPSGILECIDSAIPAASRYYRAYYP